jgi:hypothetical protein
VYNGHYPELLPSQISSRKYRIIDRCVYMFSNKLCSNIYIDIAIVCVLIAVCTKLCFNIYIAIICGLIMVCTVYMNVIYIVLVFVFLFFSFWFVLIWHFEHCN